MPPHCIFKGCEQPGRNFFCVPTDSRRITWLEVCGIPNESLYQGHFRKYKEVLGLANCCRVCSKHFRTQDINYNSGRTRTSKTAIPIRQVRVLPDNPTTTSNSELELASTCTVTFESGATATVTPQASVSISKNDELVTDAMSMSTMRSMTPHNLIQECLEDCPIRSRLEIYAWFHSKDEELFEADHDAPWKEAVSNTLETNPCFVECSTGWFTFRPDSSCLGCRTILRRFKTQPQGNLETTSNKKKSQYLKPGSKHCLYPGCVYESGGFLKIPTDRRQGFWLKRCGFSPDGTDVLHQTTQGLLRPVRAGLCQKCGLCSDHFDDEDIFPSLNLVRVKKHALPRRPDLLQLQAAGRVTSK